MALSHKQAENPGRLEEDEIAALDYVFGGMEAAVGIQSTYAAMVDKMRARPRASSKNEARSENVMHVRATRSRSYEALEPVEYWACWSTKSRRWRGLVAYRALRAMAASPGGGLHVAVLYRAYGPRPPGPAFDTLSGLTLLGRIVSFTPTAEQIAADARAQSVAGALAAILFAPVRIAKAERKALERERAALIHRLRIEADKLLADAVAAFRVAFDRAILEDDDDC